MEGQCWRHGGAVTFEVVVVTRQLQLGCELFDGKIRQQQLAAKPRPDLQKVVRASTLLWIVSAPVKTPAVATSDVNPTMPPACRMRQLSPNPETLKTSNSPRTHNTPTHLPPSRSSNPTPTANGFTQNVPINGPPAPPPGVSRPHQQPARGHHRRPRLRGRPPALGSPDPGPRGHAL